MPRKSILAFLRESFLLQRKKHCKTRGKKRFYYFRIIAVWLAPRAKLRDRPGLQVG